MTLSWIFDPVPPSGALQGGNAAIHVFNANLETLVREVIQNIRDQHLGGSVRARFAFHTLTGTRKSAFLQALGWNQLRPHVEGSAKASTSQLSHWIKNGLHFIDSNEALVVLRIDDTNTRGLIGDENDKAGNFNGLCRNTLISKDDGNRGGSYGLGKSVLWRYSGIATVLFSSLIDGPPHAGFRFFGRAELPYHVTGDDEWQGTGFYGKSQVVKHGQQRAVSAWDDEVADLANNCLLDRDPTMGTGTSILVVGFREPSYEEPRAIDKVAEEVVGHASRWFWPAMVDGHLTVEVAAYEDGAAVFNESAQVTDEVEPFVTAKLAPAFVHAPLAEGAVAVVEIPFTAPGKKMTDSQAATGEVTGKMRLLVRAAASGQPKGLHANKIAMVRGAGMVVQYRSFGRVAGDQAFHGVLLAGLANGGSPENEAIEALLRASEPPTHDRWEANARLQGEYKKGSKAALDKLNQAIDLEVTRLFAAAANNDFSGPTQLAKLFRLKGETGSSDRSKIKFTVRRNAWFEDGVWWFEGRVRRQGKEERPWAVRVALRLAGEGGQGEPLAIDTLDAEGYRETEVKLDRIVHLPAEVSTVSINGYSAKFADPSTAGLASRTGLKLELLPFEEAKQ